MTDSAPKQIRRIESALEPELPIIDPHHHFWREAGGVPPFLHPKYMLEDLFADLDTGHNIVATVFLQCLSDYRPDGVEHLRPVGETEFVHSLAQAAANMPDTRVKVAAGIIPTADLRLGAAVDEVLEAHLAVSPKRVKGIRSQLYWHDDPTIHARLMAPEPLLQHPNLRAAAARVAHYGLSFESWIYHTQLDEFTAFARDVPGLTLILNHMGGPLAVGPYADKQAEVFDHWSKGMARLSELPNVFVKLGGINMHLLGFNWDVRQPMISSADIAAATRHFYLHTIECFGPDRCLFESNFPMERVAYPTLWNVFKRIAAGFSPSEKACLFYDTARQVYRLDL